MGEQVANIRRWESLFGFGDQNVSAFAPSTPSTELPGISGGTTAFGDLGPAVIGAPFDPFGGFGGFGESGGFGGIPAGNDIDFGLDFSAASQGHSLGLPDAWDIGFGTYTSATNQMPATTERETNSAWPVFDFALSMHSLMKNFMKLFQFDSPNIDGGDTSTDDFGTTDFRRRTGDINYGGSDLNADVPPTSYQPMHMTTAPASATTSSSNAATNKARATSVGAAPGPTYVDPDPALLAEIARREKTDPAGAAKLKELAQQPVTHWLNGTPYDAQHLNEYLNKAQAAGKEGSVMFYNIPGRDNGGYSGGGARSVGEYKAWAKQMSDVIGDRKTTVYLETDAIMHTKDMSPEKADERLKLIGDTVDMLKKNNPNATVVLNAGSAGWGTPAETAALLKRANVQNADGFFLNVAGFESTADSMRHGDAIVTELDKLGITDKRYIIDTSRNGAKIMALPGTKEAWADPYGAASGVKPTTDQSIMKNPNVMALSWVKTPWAGDGRLTKPGAMNADYAIKLVENAERLGVW